MIGNRIFSCFVLFFMVVGISSCKFTFEESEYLGTYPGDFNSYLTTYKDCKGQLIITDAGNQKVNIELVTDSNPTFFINNVIVTRGFGLASDELRFYESGSYGAEGYIGRTNHSIYLGYDGGSSWDYTFYGSRQ